MLFHSLNFVIFFPIVVLLYFVLPEKCKNIWLLISSYYFYMNWNAKYALLLLGASVITYAASLVLERIRDKKNSRKMVLVTALAIVFGFLVYYKYTNFFIYNLNRVFRIIGAQIEVPTYSILLPVGISFFTFQAAGYLIDVYRGDVEVEHNLLRYLLFVSFFPQLVAGPIERSKNLLVQMKQTYSFDAKRVQHGLCIMLWGYFLKLVIADRCAVIVDAVYSNTQGYGSAMLMLTAVLFSLQIYCDFMGYSTIARGAALVLGYHIMDNFQQPYFARTIQDFWRRWHISLSTWFKDYLYIPLGGNRCSKARHYMNLMVTFLVSGLWHGAGWTFVIWGGLHGALQVCGSICKPVFRRIRQVLHIADESRVYHFICILRTDILAAIAWVFFRSDSMPVAISFLRQMFTGGLRADELWNGTLFQLGLNEFHVVVLVIGLCVLFIFSLIREKGIAVYALFEKQKVLIRYFACWVLVALIMFSFSLVGQEFIYFQF